MLSIDLPRPVADVARLRLQLAPQSAIQACFGIRDASSALAWRHADHVYFSFGSRKACREADRRNKAEGSPFPGLLDGDHGRRGNTFVENRRAAYVGFTLKGPAPAFTLAPATCLLLVKIGVDLQGMLYNIPVYLIDIAVIAHICSSYSISDCAEDIDAMLAHQLSAHVVEV